MSKTKIELLNWCQSKLGTPYVYGAKGEILTQSKINTLAAMYPSTFTSAYIAKAQTFIGQNCTDCSGLISWLTGIIRGSSQYKSTATAVYPIGQLDETMIGYALWKSGHIGIYIGNGYCIEAKGINYGTVKTKVSATAWTHILKLCDIDYAEEPVIKTGWQKDDKGWRYILEDGSFLKGWLLADYVWYWLNPGDGYMVHDDWILDKGYWYYLNSDGSLYYGWLLYKDKWLYLDKDGTPEGAAVTGLQKIKYDNRLNDYYFDNEGYMITEPITLIPDQAGALTVIQGSK